MTDYNFPIDWSTFSDEEKHEWYVEERTARRVLRQSGVSMETIQSGNTRELLAQVLSAQFWEEKHGLNRG